jgi:hypothetical protein
MPRIPDQVGGRPTFDFSLLTPSLTEAAPKTRFSERKNS